MTGKFMRRLRAFFIRDDLDRELDTKYLPLESQIE